MTAANSKARPLLFVLTVALLAATAACSGGKKQASTSGPDRIGFRLPGRGLDPGPS
jgi:hypothetical protein